MANNYMTRKMTNEESMRIMNTIIEFLGCFMPKTLVKRVISMVLIVAGLPIPRITEFTGYCERSVRDLRKNLYNGDVSCLLQIRGGGRKGKAAGFEEAIVEEVENGNYHTRQQIADMIKEKFGLSMSVSAVGKLLKKTTSAS